MNYGQENAKLAIDFKHQPQEPDRVPATGYGNGEPVAGIEKLVPAEVVKE
jgi:hypothetical protein